MRGPIAGYSIKNNTRNLNDNGQCKMSSGHHQHVEVTPARRCCPRPGPAPVPNPPPYLGNIFDQQVFETTALLNLPILQYFPLDLFTKSYMVTDEALKSSFFLMTFSLLLKDLNVLFLLLTLQLVLCRMTAINNLPALFLVQIIFYFLDKKGIMRTRK